MQDLKFEHGALLPQGYLPMREIEARLNMCVERVVFLLVNYKAGSHAGFKLLLTGDNYYALLFPASPIGNAKGSCGGSGCIGTHLVIINMWDTNDWFLLIKNTSDRISDANNCRIVVAGGDGTLNEVYSRLFASGINLKDVSVGSLCFGYDNNTANYWDSLNAKIPASGSSSHDQVADRPSMGSSCSSIKSWNHDKIKSLLVHWSLKELSQFDIWEVEITTYNGVISRHCPVSNTMKLIGGGDNTFARSTEVVMHSNASIGLVPIVNMKADCYAGSWRLHSVWNSLCSMASCCFNVSTRKGKRIQDQVCSINLGNGSYIEMTPFSCHLSEAFRFSFPGSINEISDQCNQWTDAVLEDIYMLWELWTTDFEDLDSLAPNFVSVQSLPEGRGRCSVYNNVQNKNSEGYKDFSAMVDTVLERSYRNIVLPDTKTMAFINSPCYNNMTICDTAREMPADIEYSRMGNDTKLNVISFNGFSDMIKLSSAYRSVNSFRYTSCGSYVGSSGEKSIIQFRQHTQNCYCEIDGIRFDIHKPKEIKISLKSKSYYLSS